MIDQTGVNLLVLVGTRMKKVASTAGGELHGPCPFCGGRDRFIVQPAAGNGGRWSCRQCSPTWGDAIAFVMRRDGCDFMTACENLNLNLPQRDNRYQQKPDLEAVPGGPPTPLVNVSAARTDYPCFEPAWQDAADNFVQSCTDRLHSHAGKRALSWLRERGLRSSVIFSANLGYNDQDRNQTWGTVPVWLPRGIVIPWFIDGQYWRVNIRRPTGEPKYIQAKGSANGLYRATSLITGCTAVLVEGEFDALVIQSQLTGIDQLNTYRPVATGTATGARLVKWVVRLNRASRVLLAFDQDKAGVNAALWWRAALPHARRLRPTEHDVTDMHKAGVDLVRWMESH